MNQKVFMIILIVSVLVIILGFGVKIFLDYDPLNSISAKVNRISYKPELTVENILAYKVFASIDENLNGIPRIGLRGSAKIYGEEVSIFYYIFRVPLNITRQFIGF